MSASSKVVPSGRKRKRNKLAAARQAAKPAPKGLPISLVLYGPSVPTRASQPSQPAYTVGALTAGASTPIERPTLAVPVLDASMLGLMLLANAISSSAN